MKRPICITVFLLLTFLLFARDYKNEPTIVSEIPDSEKILDQDSIELFKTMELHDKEYNIYKLGLYAKINEKNYRFEVPTSGGVPKDVVKMEFYKFDENHSAMFLLIRNSIAGYPIGPIYENFNPMLIIFSDSVYSINFFMSFSPEDPPYFDVSLYKFFNEDEKSVVIEFSEKGSDRIITKVLTFKESKLIWDVRLSNGWRTEKKVTANLNMRDSPNIKAEIIGLIPEGTKVTLSEASREAVTINNIHDRWFKTYYEGKNGWIFGGYIEK